MPRWQRAKLSWRSQTGRDMKDYWSWMISTDLCIISCPQRPGQSHWSASGSRPLAAELFLHSWPMMSLVSEFNYIWYFNELFFSTANLARAGIVIGGITKGCIDPTKHTDQKSLEATVKSAGLTTSFVDDIFESLDILKKKWTIMGFKFWQITSWAVLLSEIDKLWDFLSKITIARVSMNKKITSQIASLFHQYYC